MPLPRGYKLRYCVPCNARDRTIDPGGRCLTCGQRPNQPPAGECSLCGGVGVVDGLVVGDETVPQRCAACHGTGSYGAVA